MIVKKGGKWCAMSASGDKSLGCYDTKGEALERLRQVEAAKAASLDSVKVTRAASRVDATTLAARRGDSVRRRDFAGFVGLAAAHGDASDLTPALDAYTTPDGFVHLEGRINGVGVYEYEDQDGNRWGELRLPEHVFAPEVLNAWKLAPLTNDHPDGFVTPDNVRELAIGALGSDVRVSDDEMHTLADIAVNTADGIEALKSGKRALSCGYTVKLIERAGTYQGVPYKFIQTEFGPNHVSLVDEARGPGCEFIIDGVRSVTGDTKHMKTKSKNDAKVMIGEVEHDVPDEVAAMIEEMKAKIEEQGAKLAELGSMDEGEMDPSASASMSMPVEGMDGKGPKRARKNADALEARIAFLEADKKRRDSEFGVAVSARVELLSVAGEVLGKVDGLAKQSDTAIKRAIVCKVEPSMKGKLDGKSADFVDAAYEMAVATHRERSNADSSGDLARLLGHATIGGNADGAPKLDLNALQRSAFDSKRGAGN